MLPLCGVRTRTTHIVTDVDTKLRRLASMTVVHSRGRTFALRPVVMAKLPTTFRRGNDRPAIVVAEELQAMGREGRALARVVGACR